jgi:cobalt/nickel transport system permease protein
MSHIHIPDGVLPFWLILLGWIATMGFLVFCIRRVKSYGLEHKLPLIGVISALMIVGMTLEIVPIAYHVNLSVVAGILLGPILGFISVFIVNLIIAMFGHGGITVIGLNTLVIGVEVVFGFYLFRFLCYLFKTNKALSISFAAAISTVFSLIISTSFMIGIVYVSKKDPFEILSVYSHREIHDEESDQKESKTGSKVLSNGKRMEKMSILNFAKTVLILGFPGWLLESMISGLVIGYIFRVRPDLVFAKAT